MYKPKECLKCGCDRCIIIKSSEVIEQNKEDCLKVKFKSLCVPCFLKGIGYAEIEWEDIPYNYKICVNH